MRAYRGALLVDRHDLDLLDEAITRVIHLDRRDEGTLGTIDEYKGTYSQYVTARKQPTRSGIAKAAQRQAKEVDRLQTIVDRFGAKAVEGHDGPQRREAHRPHREQRASRARQADRKVGRALPRPRRRRAAPWLEGSGLAKSLRRRPRCSATSSSFVERRRAAADHGPQRRRQDQPPPDRWPA